MVQEEFTAMLPLQVVLLEKSELAAAGVPPAMAALNPIGAKELFVNVTVWAALAVPIAWFPNVRLEGDTANTG
jgi:hypothetical protein